MFKTQSLTPKQKKIILDKATEQAHTGAYNHIASDGTFICKNCGLPLFKANNKFDSGSGWPSFDNDIDDRVTKVSDQDEIRTEALCSNCDAHLGHVFYDEAFTALNTRYCINSAAMDLIEHNITFSTEEAILAAGCFWGVEYLFKKLDGVLKTEVGYIGGSAPNPTYESVCAGRDNSVEALRVIFDPLEVSYKDILRYFFEIHDFTQANGQGNDIGNQYLSKIFYYSEEQKANALQVIDELTNKAYEVATRVEQVSTFWPAEEYHQDYYAKTNGSPYCHFKKTIF